MKPHRFTRTILIPALLIVAGCSKRATEPAPDTTPKSATTTAATKPPPKPAAATSAKKPTPLPTPAPEPEPEPVPAILFSLRGLADGQFPTDRPLFVGVRVEPSIESAKTLTLAPATGSWSAALKVELVATTAPEKILLQAQRAGGDTAVTSVTLGSDQVAEGTWYFPSADIAKLIPGDYAVQAKLSIPDGHGWHGQVAGEPVSFKLVAAATATTADQQDQRTLALASEAMLAKDWPKAAQLLDERLATDPDNIDLLKTRALLCLEGGNALAANACVSRAWARVIREKWEHPPAELYMLNQAVLAAMAKPSTAAVPAWTQPPAAVLAPLPDAKSN